MTVAAIYARLSHDKERGTDREGKSVDEQIRESVAYAERRGLTVGPVYRDDSISAATGKTRPAFEALLKDRPEVIVVWHLDRLVRVTSELERVIKLDIPVHAVSAGDVDLRTPSGRAVARTITAWSTYEGEQKAERIKLSSLRRARSGEYRSSMRPFGQERDGTWIEVEARAVREAVENLLSGDWTFFEIAKTWNARGLVTPHPSGRTNEWTSGTVRNFFVRPRLYGYQEYDGTLYPLKDWKPLMTKEEFDAVQRIIEAKRTGRRGQSYGRADSHLLTRIAVCQCGRGMNVGYRGGKGSPKIYRCPTARHQTVTAGPLEKHVSIHVLNLLHVASRLEDADSQAQETVQTLRDRRLEVETGHRTWMEQAGAAGLDPQVIRARMTAQAEELGRIDAEIFRAEEERGMDIFPAGGMTILPDAGEEPDDLSNWEALSLPKRRRLIQSVVREVQVARGQQGARFRPERIFYRYTPRGDQLADIWYERALNAAVPEQP